MENSHEISYQNQVTILLLTLNYYKAAFKNGLGTTLLLLECLLEIYGSNFKKYQ